VSDWIWEPHPDDLLDGLPLGQATSSSGSLKRRRISSAAFGSWTDTRRGSQLADLRNAIRHSRAVDEVTRKFGEGAIIWFRQVLAK
jgi:hypothetical protein